MTCAVPAGPYGSSWQRGGREEGVGINSGHSVFGTVSVPHLPCGIDWAQLWRQHCRCTWRPPKARWVLARPSTPVVPAWLTYRGVMSELPDVKVFTFGTMPCMSLELAEACRSFVTTVVNGDDVVPRVRRENLQKLRGEVRDLGAATDARAAEPHPPSALLSVHVPVTPPPLYPSSLQLAQVRWQAELRDSVLDEAARARISTMFKTAHDHLESRRALVSQRCTYPTPHVLLACGTLRSTRTPSVHTVGTNQRAPRAADEAGASADRDHEAARRGCRGVARFWCAACCVRCAACRSGDSQSCAGLMKRLRDVLAKLGSMDVHHSLQ